MKKIKKLLAYIIIAALVIGVLPVYAYDTPAETAVADEAQDLSDENAEDILRTPEFSAEDGEKTSAAEEETEEEPAEELSKSGISEEPSAENPSTSDSSEGSKPEAEEPAEEESAKSGIIEEPSMEDLAEDVIPAESEEAAEELSAEDAAADDPAEEPVPEVQEAALPVEAEETAAVTESRTDISTLAYSLEYTSVIYDGAKKKPEVIIKDGRYKLVRGTDIKVGYTDNIDAGTANITVRGIGKYQGKLTFTFRIKRAPQKPVLTLSKTRVPVNGSVTIKTKGVGDVTFTTSDAAVAKVKKDGTVLLGSPGTVKISARFAGSSNYKAKTVSVKLKVFPAKTKITSLENTTKGIRISWNEAAGASGYYIYRSVKGTKYTLLKTIKKPTVLKATDQTVLSGKKYYYKIISFCDNYRGEASGIKSSYRLDRPVIKTVTNPKAGSVAVSWGKVKNADGYILTAAIGGTVTTCKISDPSVTTKTIKEVKNGAECTFYVIAWKDNDGKKNYSLKSKEKSITARENYVRITGSGSSRTIEFVNPTSAHQSLKAAVWSDKGEQDDLVWYTMSRNENGYWAAEASASVIAHPGLCLVHCYEEDTFAGSGEFTLTKEEQANAVNPKIHEYARNLLDQAGWTLRGAYDWSTRLPYQSMVVPLTVPAKGPYAGFNRQELYFVYAYEYGKGNCFCCAASFYWMARELGYDARLIEGKVRVGAHGWVEIDLKGVTYLCDPETEGSLGYDAYMKTYDEAPPMDYVKERPY